MKLVASMIARDELARYQPALTRHLLSYCDEVRVLDDGSRDGTGRALSQIDPERVVVIRNRSSKWDREGEGAARQQLLDWTLAADGDWVVGIDADEVIPEGQRLRVFLESRPTEVEVVGLRMVEIWERAGYVLPPPSGDLRESGVSTWQVRVDGGWAPRECPILWRPPPASMSAADAWAGGWTIPNRPLACGREPEIVRHLDAIPSGIDVLHLGWSNPAERERRYLRYVSIDGGRFHDDAHIRSIMETPALVSYPAPSGIAL